MPCGSRSSATSEQQVAWASGVHRGARSKAPGGDPAKVASGDYGPVPVLTFRRCSRRHAAVLSMGPPVCAGFPLYQTDYTKSVLFLADGSYLEDRARAENLGGAQSGMMNETGSYPGQEWLWLYTFWYQIKPFSAESNPWGANADAIIWTIMAVLTLVSCCCPTSRVCARFLGGCPCTG